MPRRGETTSEYGRASFDKEFRVDNASLGRGLDDPISPSPLQVLSTRPITQYGQYGCKYI